MKYQLLWLLGQYVAQLCALHITEVNWVYCGRNSGRSALRNNRWRSRRKPCSCWRRWCSAADDKCWSTGRQQNRELSSSRPGRTPTTERKPPTSRWWTGIRSLTPADHWTGTSRCCRATWPRKIGSRPQRGWRRGSDRQFCCGGHALPSSDDRSPGWSEQRRWWQRWTSPERFPLWIASAKSRCWGKRRRRRRRRWNCGSSGHRLDRLGQSSTGRQS